MENLGNQKQDEITKVTLCDLFILSNIIDGISFKNLRELNGEKGLATMMGINLKEGLSQDQIERQRQVYGNNIPIQKQFRPICTLILECLEDTMIRILLVAALASTIVGMIGNLRTGWAEGFTIMIAVILITGITTVNNYMKDRQFRKLQNKLDEGIVQVKRNNQVISIDIKDIVVGDLFLFNIGDKFNVDGIMIEGSQVKVDESSLTGESNELKKVPYAHLPYDNQYKISPFLVSGTKVVDGSGIMLVLAVGQSTCQNQMIQLLEVENPPTPLQLKLQQVAEDIGKLGLCIAIITFLALIIRYIIDCASNTGYCLNGFQFLNTFKFIIEAFMIGVTIVVVAVPEGLPLAVTLTLAFSVNKMKDEQNLVKTLASCEIMGGANNICTDKTGTLTQNKMKVVKLFHQNELLQNLQSQQFLKPQYSQFFAEAVCINSSAFPQRNPISGELDSTGNKSECALLILADQWGYDYTKYRHNNNIIISIPFNSARKKMITVIYIEATQTLRVFIKGASELILEDCTSFLQPDNTQLKLNQYEKQTIRNKIIEQFAKQALRTLAIAYKDIERPQVQGGQEGLKKWLQDQGDDYLVQDLTLISIAGIQDPLRNDVTASIQQCKKSGITVRMVTGDNLITAKAIARECGILDQNSTDLQAMEGKDFRKLVGGIKVIKNAKGEETNVVENLYEFQKINNELRVLARASPEDKYILVTGLIQLENVVAVTGDGTNDAPALRKADVGFAMGIAGSDVAKEAADIILLDDNFSSIVTACKWGRNIYNCIRKFIQFQLTVNIVALTMVVLGAIALKVSPLNTIEMLWVNLIMDTFASLALATEPPSMEVLNKTPYSRTESIINAQMYRFIIFQSLFQLACLCYILFSPPADLFIQNLDKEVFQKPFNFSSKFNLKDSRSFSRLLKLDEASLNPFSRATNNMIFWFIQIFTLIVQYVLIEYGGQYFVGVIGLNWEQHVFCLCLGIVELIYGVIIRAFVPLEIFKFLQVSNDKNSVHIKELQQSQSIELSETIITQ